MSGSPQNETLKTEAQKNEIFGKAVGNLFRGGPANVSWEQALEGLEAGDAARAPNNMPHSIAQIVAHVQFWQAFTLDSMAGNNSVPPEHAADGWPTPDPWNTLRAVFLRDARRLRDHARDPAFCAGTDREGRPYAAVLTNYAGHGVYHLGQVVSIRQALGLWPPPGGGDTW